METFFKLKTHGTNVRTEVLAGATTFFTMAYIVAVNPNMLAITGMNKNGVFVATVLATVIGTLMLGLFANLPYAQAPGMGLNAFFTFTVCLGMGFAWQEALAMVFICGIVGMIITATKVRATLIRSIPESLKNGIGGAIGLFIAYIGVKGAGFLKFTADAGTYNDFGGTIVTDSSIVPALADFSSKGAIVALIGLVITVALIVLKIKGAIFIGIIATTILGIPFGVTDVTHIQWLSFDAIGDVKETAFSFFGSPGLGSMFTSTTKIFMSLCAIFAFVLSDVFDTIGTFIGTGRVSGIFDEADEKNMMVKGGLTSKMERGLFADLTATVVGSLLGTSNVTTYVESSAGIAQGGRTGLTSLTTAILFLLCLPFAGLISIIPGQATAPALIVVGILMMSNVARVNWSDFGEAAPVFLTMAFCVFSYNISYGIAAGLVFHCIVKLVKREFKDLNPIVCGAAVLFLLNFLVTALRAAGKI